MALLGDQRPEHALADGRRRAELAEQRARGSLIAAAQRPRAPAGAGAAGRGASIRSRIGPSEPTSGCASSTASARGRGDLAPPLPGRRAARPPWRPGRRSRRSARPARSGSDAGARLGDHDAAVGHRLDHARPLEVAGTPVVAVDVDEDLGRGEQAVLVGAEHEAGRAGAHRRGEAEQAQVGPPVLQHRAERGEQSASRGVSPPRNSTSRSRARGRGHHRRDAAEHEPLGAHLLRTQGLDPVGVDVEGERGGPAQRDAACGTTSVPGCSVQTGTLIAAARRDGRARRRRRARTARAARPPGWRGSDRRAAGRSTSVAVRPVAAAASTNHVAMSVMKPLPPPATNTATSLRVAPSPTVIATGGRDA